MTRGRILLRNFLRLAVLTPVLVAAYWGAWALRYDFQIPAEGMQLFWLTLPCVLVVKVGAAFALQSRHEWLRYIAFRDLVMLAGLLLGATVVTLCVDWVVLASRGISTRLPLSVIVLDYALSLLFLGGLCSLQRFRHEHLKPLMNMLFSLGNEYQRALIVGANRSGVVMANQIQFHPRLRYIISGFLDADESLQGTRFGGILVRGGLRNAGRIARDCGAGEVFVLDKSLSGVSLRDLLSDCQQMGVQVRIISSIYDLLSGAGKTKVLVRDVDINDLLRRDPIELDNAALREMLEGRTVLVSGAGGSIGSEICRQVMRYNPRVIALVERAENNLFHIERELRALGLAAQIIPFIADVTDERRMRQVFERSRPDVLFHAAAHKHVPMMESNPGEAIANNVFGTRLTADLADEFGVRQFVFISTDKAVRPTSVMGLTKQIAERYVHSLSQSSKTRFMVVRFGNVLGSAGSVVPLFQEQIRRGGPVTVTHPDMRRFFMTIPEASQLVLQAGAMGRGGEIFVLDMGEPVKIVDLARDLIRLSGLSESEIEICFTGVRPGEKLYEELYFSDEQTLPTKHPKLSVAYFRPGYFEEIGAILQELLKLMREPDAALVHHRLRELFPDFGVAPPAESEDGPAAEPGLSLVARKG